MRLLQFATCLAGVMLACELSAQTNTVTIRVRDISGKPIAGATVESRSLGDSELDLNAVPNETKSAITDSNGVVKVALAGRWGQVVARKSGMAVAGSCFSPMDLQLIDLTLYQPASVSGIVVDESNRPVPDAKVIVSGISCSSWVMNAEFLEPYLSTRTGTDGRFHIEGVPTNSVVDFSVVKKDKVFVHPAGERVGYSTRMGGAEDIQLKMQPAGSIEGQLFIPDEGRNLQPFVILFDETPQRQLGGVRPRKQQAVGGRFRFENLAPGKYQVLACFGPVVSPDWVAQPQTVSVAAGQVTRDVKIVAGKGGILEVKVVSSMEHKPMNAVVSTYDLYFRVVGALGINTGSNGVATIRLCPGEHNFFARQEQSVSKKMSVQIEEGKTNRVEVELRPSPIAKGTVRDPSGAPVAGIEVRLFPDEASADTTDANGRFRLKPSLWGIGKGFMPLVVVRDSKRNWVAACRFEEGRDNYDLQVSPGKRIAGVVVGLDGKPVAGAHVDFDCPGQPDGKADTDGSGRFAFDLLCEGTITVRVNTSGSDLALYGGARVEAGETNFVIALGRQPGLPPTRPSLVGKPLPDLSATGISAGVIQTNKPLLICLFDPEQRPSRRAMRFLGEQNDALKQKGVVVVGVSVAKTKADALKEWKESNPVPFPIGGVTEKNDKTGWILNTEKFPWLILTDGQGRVKAEGFELDELDGKLK